ncbi:MAG TPA: 2-hydroxyacyl-CoA dehydratase family protein, partial [Anaerovoracaceae bacterium]|nr:2-hydroxyacyl-CoA dehydratase family protein [Anaerovoracaceae bacterium]
KKAVGCFPIYAPEEIVYAAGALPVGMWGGPTLGNLSDKYFQTFCCSIMKANMEQALKGIYENLSAVIISTFCDTLKCTIENWKAAVSHLNIVPIVYPQNRKSDAGKAFLKEEFQRITGELENILNVTVNDSDLEESFKIYEDYRATMRRFVKMSGNYPVLFDAVTRHQIIKAAYFMDKKIFTAKLKKLLEHVSQIPVEKFDGKRIIITGLLAEPDEFLELFSENNLVIVADDLAQESRQFRAKAPKEGTAMERMIERVALQDGCSFLYDFGKSRIDMLIDLKNEYNADGIVFCQLKFCDPEEFDYPLIKKGLEARGIPMLYLEIEQQMDSVEQLRTRIQTFSEIL